MSNESETNQGLLYECLSLLKENKNIVLSGAPGTGKTWMAKEIASQMLFGVTYNEALENNPLFKERVGFVQFHPSYDYTDFVEGLRPTTTKASSVNFKRADGVFKLFCKQAIADSGNVNLLLYNMLKCDMTLETNNGTSFTLKFADDGYNIKVISDLSSYILSMEVFGAALEENNDDVDVRWFENYLNEHNIRMFDMQKDHLISHFYLAVYKKVKEIESNNESQFTSKIPAIFITIVR